MLRRLLRPSTSAVLLPRLCKTGIVHGDRENTCWRVVSSIFIAVNPVYHRGMFQHLINSAFAVVCALLCSSVVAESGRGRQLKDSDDNTNIIVGSSLLAFVIFLALVFAVYIECTSPQDAFGRGPFEQACARRCHCCDRSQWKLGTGKDVYTSGNTPAVQHNVRNPLAEYPSADMRDADEEGGMQDAADNGKDTTENR